MGALLHSRLHTPFFAGTSSPPAGIVPWKLPCSLGNIPLIIDFAKYRRTTLQIRRLGTDDSVEPGESSLNAAGVWARAQDNWFLGAGQKYMDQRFAFESVYVHSGEYPSVRTRYWKSLGVNPWHEGHLTLQPKYGSIATSTGKMLTCAARNFAYYSAGPDLFYAARAPGDVGTPSWTQVTTTNTQDIVSITTDGSRVWFACGTDGVFVTDAGSGTASAAGTPAALPNPQGLLAADGTGTVNATNLPNGATTWHISAVDAFGNETAATPVTHTVASVPVELTWNPMPAASSFNVYRGTNELVATGLTSPAFTDDGTVAGTTQAFPTTNGTGSSEYPGTFVAYASGHLISSTGRDLVELLADGTVTFIFEHEDPNFIWTCACETPSAILVGGCSDSTYGPSFIGAIQPDSSTNGATLAPPTTSTTLPPGEAILSLAYSAGSILMGTSEGIRSGTRPDSTGVFDVNPVIEDPGACNVVVPWQQNMYFGWSNLDPNELWSVDRSILGGIGRADLSQFVNSGVPAFASDVMSNEAGVVPAQGLMVLQGTVYFVTTALDGSSKLWGPTGKYVDEGWLEPGWIRYGTIEPKIIVEVDWQNEPLPANTSIGFQIVDESYAVNTIGSETGEGMTTLDDPLSAGLAVGNRYQPIITLSTSDGDSTPDLVSWVSKAVVVPKRQDEILLPVMLYETVSTYQPGDEQWPQDTLNLFLELKALEAAGAPLPHTLGSDTHQVYIDQIMLGDENTSMNSDRSFLNTICTVKVLTLS